MRINEFTMLVSNDVVLVPYREEHVRKYHEWMQDPELRELTASELLTLEEEYEMQRKWREDDDKLTFIVCIRQNLQVESTFGLEDLTMVGDVNLFLKGSPPGRNGDDEYEDFEVEVEVMIAEREYRRRGIAYTALQLLLSYATSPFSLSTTSPPPAPSPSPLPIPRRSLVARIGESNISSIRLFKKLGFELTKRVEVFEEVELRFRGGGGGEEGWKEWEGGKVMEAFPPSVRVGYWYVLFLFLFFPQFFFFCDCCLRVVDPLLSVDP